MRSRSVYAVLALVIAVSLVGAFPATALAYSPWDTSYTHDELMLMARLIYAEAAGEPYVGKVAVGAVVLNRVRSPVPGHHCRGHIRAVAVLLRGQLDVQLISEPGLDQGCQRCPGGLGSHRRSAVLL